MPSRHPPAIPATPGSRPPPEPSSGLGASMPKFSHTALTPGEISAAAVLTLAVGAFFLSVFLVQAGEGRARGAVEAWARANQLEVIKTAVVKKPRGPFRGRPPWQTVSAVTVRTPQGFNRSAWICWGNLFFLYLGTPAVEWDDEAGKRAS